MLKLNTLLVCPRVSFWGKILEHCWNFTIFCKNIENIFSSQNLTFFLKLQVSHSRWFPCSKFPALYFLLNLLTLEKVGARNLIFPGLFSKSCQDILPRNQIFSTNFSAILTGLSMGLATKQDITCNNTIIAVINFLFWFLKYRMNFFKNMNVYIYSLNVTLVNFPKKFTDKLYIPPKVDLLELLFCQSTILLAMLRQLSRQSVHRDFTERCFPLIEVVWNNTGWSPE